MTESVTSLAAAQGWRAVIASCDLAKGEVIPSALDSVAIAIWRSNDGVAHAWFDRCPHRGMRLSHGSVSDAGLVCPYHGWRFGADTQCNHIPAHPQMNPPKAARAKDFRIVEDGGYVWASVDAEPSGPPVTHQASHPVRSIFIGADAEEIMSALKQFPLDPTGLRKTPIGPDQDGFSTASIDELNIEAKWSIPGDKTFSYTVHLQPLREHGCMVHLATNEALGKGEMAAMNVSLVALRDWIAS